MFNFEVDISVKLYIQLHNWLINAQKKKQLATAVNIGKKLNTYVCAKLRPPVRN
jgi:hypothetical protein